MKIKTSEWIWLNGHDVCSAKNLVEISGLSSEEFEELVDVGVIEPVDETAQERSFHVRYVVTANTARRLRDDFDLDINGVALAMTLMKRINSLHEELLAVKARFG
jgi:chaperone modulatory protein CbpM